MFAKLPWPLFWALSAQALLSVTRFFSKMVVGGSFSDGVSEGLGSVAEFGYFDAAFGVLMMVTGLHEAFVTTPLTFFNHREKTTDERKFAGRMLIVSILFSILSLALLTATVGYKFFVAGESNGLLVALFALGLTLPFQLVRETARRWLLANLQVKRSALIEILFASMFIALLAALIFTKQVSAVSVFTLTAVANFACLICWWMVYRNSFDLNRSGVREQIGENFGYGKWIACENFCSVLMIYFSQWYLLTALGVVGAGVYSACMTIVLLANPFLLGVVSLFAPRSAQEFNQNSWPGLLKMLFGYSLFVGGVLACFSFTLYLFGDPLTQAIWGSQYQAYFIEYFDGVNSTTFIMSLATPFFGVSYLLTCCLLAADKPLYSFYSAVVGLAVSVVFNLSFAEPTLNTAAYSFLAGVIATTTTRGAMVWYTHRQHQRDRIQ